MPLRQKTQPPPPRPNRGARERAASIDRSPRLQTRPQNLPQRRLRPNPRRAAISAMRAITTGATHIGSRSRSIFPHIPSPSHLLEPDSLVLLLRTISPQIQLWKIISRLNVSIDVPTNAAEIGSIDDEARKARGDEGPQHPARRVAAPERIDQRKARGRRRRQIVIDEAERSRQQSPRPDKARSKTPGSETHPPAASRSSRAGRPRAQAAPATGSADCRERPPPQPGRRRSCRTDTRPGASETAMMATNSYRCGRRCDVVLSAKIRRCASMNIGERQSVERNEGDEIDERRNQHEA